MKLKFNAMSAGIIAGFAFFIAGNAAAQSTGSVAIGEQAGENAGGVANTFVGQKAGRNQKPEAGGNGQNTSVGLNAGSGSTGSHNAYIGDFAGVESRGSFNVIIGHGAGTDTTKANTATGGSEGGVSGMSGSGNVAIGMGAGVSAAMVNGQFTTVVTNAQGTVAIGTGAYGGGDGAVSLGTGSKADKASSIAIGSEAKSLSDGCIALGFNTRCTTTGSVALGSGTQTTKEKQVAVGGRTIGQLADGVISPVSMEAINGSQLYKLGSTTAEVFGNGVKFTNDGRLIGSLKWRGQDYTSVQNVLNQIDVDLGKLGGGATFIAVNKDGNISVVKQADGRTSFDLSKTIKVDSIQAGGNVLSKDALSIARGSKIHAGNNRVEGVADAVADTDAVNKRQLDKAVNGLTNGVVRYDVDADGNPDYSGVTLGGPGARNETAQQGYPLTTIRNVNAGSADTDAVNVSQLKEVKNWFNDRIDDNWDAISRLDRKVDGLDKRMREMGAMSAALAMMNGAGQPGLPVGKLSVGGAWGMYMDKAAFAVGAKLRTTEQISISMGFSMSGGKGMGGAAFSWTEK